MSVMDEIAETQDLVAKALKLAAVIKPVKVCWEWQEWLDSRQARRAVAQRIGPPVSRRESSSSDVRLRALFNGKRGPDFQ